MVFFSFSFLLAFSLWASSFCVSGVYGGSDSEGGIYSVINVLFSQMQGVHTPFGG
jgi:hypothetical protein